MATGTISLATKKNYSTKGPDSVLSIRQTPPKTPAPRCYIDHYPLTQSCSENQIAALAANNATVVNRIIVEPAA